MRIKRKIVYLCENKKVHEIIFASSYGFYRPNLKAENNGPKSKVTVPLIEKRNKKIAILFLPILWNTSKMLQ